MVDKGIHIRLYFDAEVSNTLKKTLIELSKSALYIAMNFYHFFNFFRTQFEK